MQLQYIIVLSARKKSLKLIFVHIFSIFENLIFETIRTLKQDSFPCTLQRLAPMMKMRHDSLFTNKPNYLLSDNINAFYCCRSIPQKEENGKWLSSFKR